MHIFKFGFVMLAALILVWGCSSTLTEEEYYENAKTAYGKGEFSKAIENFKQITEKYPDGKRAAESLFMLGFINANDMKNYDEAEKYYSLFIEKHPDHDLADDAQYELQTLGTDINDLPIFQNLQADSIAQ